MRIVIHTTVDKKHTTAIAKKVQQRYKKQGFDFDFYVEPINLDVSNKVLYQFNWSRSFQELTLTKSISTAVMRFLKRADTDMAVLFVDDAKAPQSAKLRGQQDFEDGYSYIEVYSEPESYIKKRTRRNKTRYVTTEYKSGWQHDEYVLYHEIAHHFEDLAGHKGRLHKEIKKDKLFSYVESILPEAQNQPESNDLGITKGTRGLWQKTQGFGENGVCVDMSGKVTSAQGTTCPEGTKSLYKTQGLKGHNGVDWYCPKGWKLYCNVFNKSNPLMTWTAYNYNTTYGKKLVLISDEPLFFKTLPKELDTKSFAQYKVDGGYKCHVGVVYLHIGRSKVKDGQKVRYGDYIAVTGNSGLSTGPHTHEAVKLVTPEGFALNTNNGYRGAFNHEPFYNV